MIIIEDQITHIYYRNLYIEYLSEMVHYDPKKPPRPRVKNIDSVWKKIDTKQLFIYDFSCYENIYFYSDPHFFHKNVIKYTNRPHKSTEEMNIDLLTNYNLVVGDKDLVIWLGDVAISGVNKTNNLLSMLNGDKILIIGNHDIEKKKVKKLDFLDKMLLLVFSYKDKQFVCTHYPLPRTRDFNVHGHIHEKHSKFPYQLNVSVEWTSYMPISIEDLYQRAIAGET